jgi:uncharacterized membrane protein
MQMNWMILFGISAGMRTMTGIAVMCWFAWLGLLPQTGWSAWVGHPVSVIVFTILAVGEYYGDTRPDTPNRTAAFPLIARLVFGSLVAALAAHATLSPAAGGVLFGAIGVLIGAFGGMRLRLWASRRVGRDLPVALGESALALALALYGTWTYHLYYMMEQANS